VVTEFALPAAHTLQAARIVKNDRENPQAPRRHQPAAVCGGAQDLSFIVDTEWGDKFRTESGSFIAV
jgi:hypothetical protein